MIGHYPSRLYSRLLAERGYRLALGLGTYHLITKTTGHYRFSRSSRKRLEPGHTPQAGSTSQSSRQSIKTIGHYQFCLSSRIGLGSILAFGRYLATSRSIRMTGRIQYRRSTRRLIVLGSARVFGRYLGRN